MKKNRLIPELVTAVLILLMLVFPLGTGAYRRYETDTLRYLSARVVQVQEETLEQSPVADVLLGQQRLLVQLPGGERLEVMNYLTHTHNVPARPGMRLIVCADEPAGAEPYYTVYNYDRSFALAALVAVFGALLVLVGRRKGFDAFLAIAFTLCFVLRVLLPFLYAGGPPVALGLLTVVLSAFVTLVLMHGATGQCLLGVAATMLGELTAAGLFFLFSGLLHLTALQTTEGEGLLMIAMATGLRVDTLLQAGVMLASVGAVMDVAVSVLSALREIAAAAPDISRRRLFGSGMRMGQDLIGTMSNTLIFAFAGGSLSAMLVLCSCGVQPHQLLSSDYLALELAQGLCSTAAVILTVPAAAWLGSAFFAGGKWGRM